MIRCKVIPNNIVVMTLVMIMHSFNIVKQNEHIETTTTATSLLVKLKP